MQDEFLKKALSKLESEKEQSELNEERRKQSLDQRMVMLREHMLNRTRFEDFKVAIHSGSPARINHSLGQCGLPLLPSGPPKGEGEEVQDSTRHAVRPAPTQ